MYKDKNKQREYNRNWNKKRRLEFFKDKKCIICDSTEELELDHVNPADKVSHKIWTWAKDRRNAELQKCQVLCKVCHKKKTYFSDNPDIKKSEHGTVNRYDKYRCRCGLCREARRLKNKQFLQRKRAKIVAQSEASKLEILHV